MASNQRWKDGLLKSSLPLEQLVAEILAKRNFYVCGEYSYLRKNESGIETEFSIDLEAFELFPKPGGTWGNLQLLIECKYNYPTVRWVFTPHINIENVSAGVISCFDHLCTEIIQPEDLFQFDQKLDYCVSGVELHENGEVNRQSITRATHQIRYGMIPSVVRQIEVQLETFNEVDLAAALYCPMIITTSQLYVLKTGMTLEKYQDADTLEDIAVPTGALIISKGNGPQFDQEIDREISSMHKRNPLIKQRLEQIATVRGRDLIAVTGMLDFNIRFAPQNILIVNYYEFDASLRRLRQVVRRAGRNRSRIGMLAFSRQTRRTQIVPVPSSAQSIAT